ncbi:amino acid adenylation domain-containing protein [Tenacibaculum tangerinum]|uniref:Amino acid adenylation domain-containing protein n=1 Tax=Tenacibaculum tangerinum TaxID=3038772 RepID=A0ABY8L0Q5_9FLAO|nr:non-ribosomal peptide synthetase [Tenacibaculum tangerinum]WGH74222.1 amino acid adenylation domain-containing protein [Tenacibaculum tangerinum]
MFREPEFQANAYTEKEQQLHSQEKQVFKNKLGISMLLTDKDMDNLTEGSFFSFSDKIGSKEVVFHCYFDETVSEHTLKNWVETNSDKLLDLPFNIVLKTNHRSFASTNESLGNYTLDNRLFFNITEDLLGKKSIASNNFTSLQITLKNNFEEYEFAESLSMNSVIQYTKDIDSKIAEKIAVSKKNSNSNNLNLQTKHITLQVLCITGETQKEAIDNAYQFLYERAKENNSYWLNFITNDKKIGEVLSTLSSEEKEYVLKSYIDKCIKKRVLIGTTEYCKAQIQYFFSLGINEVNFITSPHNIESQNFRNSISLLENVQEEKVESEENSRRDSLCPIVSPEFMEEAKTEIETQRVIKEDREDDIFQQENFTLPLTGDQKALLVLSKVSKGAMMTNSQTWALKVEGALDIDKLQKAYQKVTDRHNGMRITIDEETLEQTFHQQFAISIGVLQMEEEQNSEKFIEEFLKQEASRQYDLSKSLHRLTVLKINENYSVIVLSCNHITIDGVGVSVLYTELAAYYNNLNAKLDKTMGFDKFVKWRLVQSEEKHFKLQEKYWLDEVNTEIPVLDLPLDHARPLSNQYNGSSYLMNFQKDFFKELKDFSVENNCTYFMVVFAAFQVLLYRLSSQKKSVIGVAFNGRTIPNSDLMIGFCANIYPILCEIEPEESILDFLSRVKYKLFSAYENQDYPFSELIQKGLKNRDVSRFPFFSVAFNWDRLTLPKMDGAKVSWEVFKQEHVKLDLVPNLMEVNGELSMTLEYNTDLFDITTIERFCKYYEDILYTIIKDPKASISSLGNCIKSDVLQVQNWQGNRVTTHENTNAFHELFEYNAKLTPNKIALIQGNNKLTYKQVNEKANQLSRKFYNEGYQKGDLVGICLEKSFNQIISILGVMKAGLAYVPINPEFPESRISQLITDAVARSIITIEEYASKLPVDDSKKIILDNPELQIVLEKNSTANLALEMSREDLLYVMYTSGTTGKPKGVRIDHKGILNLAHNFSVFFKEKEIDIDQNWGWNSTFTFDGSLNALTQFYQGRTLVLLEDAKEKSPEDFWKYLHRMEVKVVDVSPSQLQFLLSGLSSGNIHTAPNLVIGGEATGQRLLEEIKNYCKQYNVTAFNVYGPTECSVVSHISVMTDHEKPVIGKTLDNVEAYVVNNLLQQVPIGAKGELLLGGVGVSNGYHNNQKLTEQKFINLPELTKSRLYKTGDIVRWLPGGVLEYVGRSDNQVQIRGVRIELGEVKTLINKMDEISECIVVAKKDTNNVNSLVVYLVLNKDIVITESELFQKMKLYLPTNMLPSSVIFIEEIPMTLNGKVDYSKLPDTNNVIKNDYVPPVKDIEKILCMIWQDALELDKIGVYDDFFFIGGHSLTAMKIIAKIQTLLGRKVTLTEIFKYSNIALLAEFLEREDKQKSDSEIITVHTEKNKERVLSFQQESFWLIDKVVEDRSIYNVTEIFEFSGEVNSNALNKALCDIVERHEVLRTVIQLNENNAPISILLDKPTDLLEIVNCDEHAFSENFLKEQQKKVFRTIFDLSKGYMLRVRLVKVSDTKSFLLLAIPHIAIDGWSMNIFKEELKFAYKNAINGNKNTFQKLPIQYADYATWQRNKFTDTYLEEQKSFWVNKLKGIPLLHSLPLDHPRQKVKSYQGTAFKHSVGKELYDKIVKFNAKHGVTMFVTLQSAFAILLRKWSSKQDIVMGTPVANRSLKEVQGLIGMFVNTMILRNEVRDNISFLSFIEQNKENIIQAFEYQDYPFNFLVENINPIRELGHSPIFQIMFALENSTESSGVFAEDVTINKVKKAYYSSKFDLTLYMNQKEEDITIEWEYDTTLFEGDTIERIAESFINLLESIVTDPNTPIKKINLSTEKFKKKILSLSKGEEQEIDNTCIHAAFEQQVLKNPESIAIEYLNTKISYQELNLKSNKIANYLISKGLKKGDFVVIHAQRSIETFSCILAVLKAGGIYLPLDSGTPKGRIKHILESSKAQFIICDKNIDKKAFENYAIINLNDQQVVEAIEKQETDNTFVKSVSSDLAYAIYTSGSSGLPKGCLLSHSNAQNLILSCRQILNFTPNSRVLQFASISFDASVFEWINALTLGSTLIIVPEEIRTIPEELSSFIKEKK